MSASRTRMLGWREIAPTGCWDTAGSVRSHGAAGLEHPAREGGRRARSSTQTATASRRQGEGEHGDHKGLAGVAGHSPVRCGCHGAHGGHGKLCPRRARGRAPADRCVGATQVCAGRRPRRKKRQPCGSPCRSSACSGHGPTIKSKCSSAQQLSIVPAGGAGGKNLSCSAPVPALQLRRTPGGGGGSRPGPAATARVLPVLLAPRAPALPVERGRRPPTHALRRQ